VLLLGLLPPPLTRPPGAQEGRQGIAAVSGGSSTNGPRPEAPGCILSGVAIRPVASLPAQPPRTGELLGRDLDGLRLLGGQQRGGAYGDAWRAGRWGGARGHASATGIACEDGCRACRGARRRPWHGNVRAAARATDQRRTGPGGAAPRALHSLAAAPWSSPVAISDRMPRRVEGCCCWARQTTTLRRAAARVEACRGARAAQRAPMQLWVHIAGQWARRGVSPGRTRAGQS
jgi:hypothetical protein